MVYRGQFEHHFGRDDSADDPLLVVEIAATSRAHDEAKAALYARRGVPVYWLVERCPRTRAVGREPLLDDSYPCGITEVL